MGRFGRGRAGIRGGQVEGADPDGLVDLTGIPLDRLLADDDTVLANARCADW